MKDTTLTHEEKLKQEQKLLSKLYDCQEDLCRLSEYGNDDFHNLLLENIIKHLEYKIQNKIDLV